MAREHFLEALPFPHHRAEAKLLIDKLVRVYPREARIEGVLRRAGLSIGDIEFGPTARITWGNVLWYARNNLLIDKLLDEVLQDGDATAIREDVRKLRAPDGEVDPGGPREDGGLPRGARTWGSNQGKAPGDESARVPAARGIDRIWQKHLERATGAKSTLLDMAFLEEGLSVARSVARLRVSFGGLRRSGTGFLVGPDLLLTNHHVLFDIDVDPGDPMPPADEVEIWLNYERSRTGDLRPVQIVKGDPASIQGDPELDWAVVRLANPPDPAKYPALTLPRKIDVRPDDSVCIVQHPRGETKHIGILRNLVVEVTDDLLRYLTDTDEGSSGSPVFDTKWQVVALHHASWSPDDDPTEIRNQGVRIDVIADALARGGFLAR